MAPLLVPEIEFVNQYWSKFIGIKLDHVLLKKKKKLDLWIPLLGCIHTIMNGHGPSFQSVTNSSLKCQCNALIYSTTTPN